MFKKIVVITISLITLALAYPQRSNAEIISVRLPKKVAAVNLPTYLSNAARPFSAVAVEWKNQYTYKLSGNGNAYHIEKILKTITIEIFLYSSLPLEIPSIKKNIPVHLLTIVDSDKNYSEIDFAIGGNFTQEEKKFENFLNNLSKER